MNISEYTNTWKVEYGKITNLKTGITKSVTGIPSSNTIAHMDTNKFIQKCSIAFNTGSWPLTRKVCGYCRQERFEQQQAGMGFDIFWYLHKCSCKKGKVENE